LPKDAKHASFIEDVAVPPERLPEFVAAFQEILADRGTFDPSTATPAPAVSTSARWPTSRLSRGWRRFVPSPTKCRTWLSNTAATSRASTGTADSE